MSELYKQVPPDADEVLRRLSSPSVAVARCGLLAGCKVTKLLRRVSWTATGIETIEKIDTPVLFAANHQSHVDTHAILDVLPRHRRNRTAVAAAFDHFGDSDGTSMKKKFIQFTVLAVWNAFGIERIGSPLRSIRTMSSLIKQGWSIVLYPEGTRSETDDIAEFKPGLAVIAKLAKCQVVPVFVTGGRTVLPKATYVPRSGSMRISFGEPLTIQKSESAEDFTARVENEVRKLKNKS
ncbi:MAG: lysophospholipid acyltransferase family protein [Phycisphaerales bacterium]|jgi:1-acyl-sn-glycerol-3-phosphate acyltransferase|nr:lysophospholipid acyltransferase family protein [Phycisphaerales bacterium]